MTHRVSTWVVAALVMTAAALTAQAPDGNAILRGAGVSLPRGGAAAAFDLWMTGPVPVPPGAFSALIVGMGPVGDAARVRNAYAFGVLAGRSGRTVPPGQLAGAGVTLLQMITSEDRASRVAGMRVAGRAFAAPVDGLPAPLLPPGLGEGAVRMLNATTKEERDAAVEAVGLLKETAALASLTELFQRLRGQRDTASAAVALEALTRIGDSGLEPLIRALATDAWGQGNDTTRLIVAFARERFLKDGSAAHLREAASHRTLGPRARVYLTELGLAAP